jgi:hypothetical protein
VSLSPSTTRPFDAPEFVLTLRYRHPARGHCFCPRVLCSLSPHFWPISGTLQLPVTVVLQFPTEDIGMIPIFLATRKWFTVADLRDGYWNVRIAQDSRYLTAVKTVIGLVHYTRMTMGLKNALAHFQRFVNKVCAGLKGGSLQVYLDDIAVGSDTPEQHVKDVREMLQQTRAAGLKLKLKKCGFGKDSIEILGHSVRLGEVRPNDAHRECVSRLNEPTNATELLRFLGVLQFFSAHIDHLAEMAAPLYQVLEGTKWNAKKPTKRSIIKIEYWDGRWNEQASESFKRLREDLADPLFLVPAHPGERKKLFPDSSRYGLGAALLQDEGEKGWLPIGVVEKLKGAEARYTTTEKENLAAQNFPARAVWRFI